MKWLFFFLLPGCSAVCAKNWEASQSVGHSAVFGQTYETQISVGGDIGSECKAD